jgi:hypothetical protein
MEKDQPVENNTNQENTEDTTTNVSSVSTSQNHDKV